MNFKQAAVMAALEAGKVHLKYFKKIKLIKVKSKGKIGLVTNADIEAEKKIASIIIKNFPKHDIVSEEEINISTGSDYKWFIDPLDGTHNYVHGMPYFGVSIALAYKEKVMLGVIYLPYYDELYVAEKGKGAFSSGKRLKVSDRPMNRSMVCYDGALHRLKSLKLRKLGDLVDNVFRVRIIGCAVVSLLAVAKGEAEMYIEFSSNSWDVAAGFLMVEEAGGKITDMKGKPWTPYVSNFIVSNGKVHSEALGIIKE